MSEACNARFRAPRGAMIFAAVVSEMHLVLLGIMRGTAVARSSASWWFGLAMSLAVMAWIVFLAFRIEHTGWRMAGLCFSGLFAGQCILAIALHFADSSSMRDIPVAGVVIVGLVWSVAFVLLMRAHFASLAAPEGNER
jgi:hypothetical protein